MLTFLLFVIVAGLIAGAIARLLVPGRDDLGLIGTFLLGLVGSFVGGFLGYMLLGHDVSEGALQPSGLLGSVIGAVIALLIYRRVGSGHRSHARV